MKIQYVSDVTNKIYNSAQECEAAEKAFHEKQNREKIEKERAAAFRKEAADKVSKARADMLAAQKAYKEALTAFCHDYGPYHESIKPTDFDDALPTLLNLLNIL